MKNTTLIPQTNNRNHLIKTAGLFLLLGSSFLPSRATPCDSYTATPGKASSSQASDDTTTSAPDYYQSTDNPYRAD